MSKTYPLGIVGEASYQPAIKRCVEGQPVLVLHEPDNPIDDLALVVATDGGETIGYIPKSSWLRDAIHEEGKGCTATIMSIDRGGAGLLAVVLEVSLGPDGIGKRPFSRAPASKSSRRASPLRGWLSRLLGV